MPLNINAGDDEDEIYLAHNLSRLQDHNDLHVLDFSKHDTNLTYKLSLTGLFIYRSKTDDSLLFVYHQI